MGFLFSCAVPVAASAIINTLAGQLAFADTLETALVQAYQNNPQINAQRAGTRAVDENVAVAVSGYRPRVTATTSLTDSYLETVTRVPTGNIRTNGWGPVTAFGVTGTQTILNGFQTANRTRQSEAQVFGSRETLRGTEQTVLLNAVIAYMNLLRDGAILELQRSNVRVLEATLRQTVVQSWGQLQAAKAQIEATTAQVNAAEIALNGVREEARVGQRTTLDVLNAQQDLVNARVALVTAQRDRVVASYTVLASTGALSPSRLGLRTQIYDPVVHYQQIRDSWFGVRTPDGR